MHTRICIDDLPTSTRGRQVSLILCVLQHLIRVTPRSSPCQSDRPCGRRPIAPTRISHSTESFVPERSPIVSMSTAAYIPWTPLGALYESFHSNHSSSHTASSLPRVRREVDRHKLARPSSPRHPVTSSERTWHNIYQSGEVRLHDGSFHGRRHFKSTTGDVEYSHPRCTLSPPSLSADVSVMRSHSLPLSLLGKHSPHLTLHTHYTTRVVLKQPLSVRLIHSRISNRTRLLDILSLVGCELTSHSSHLPSLIIHPLHLDVCNTQLESYWSSIRRRDSIILVARSHATHHQSLSPRM